MLSPRSKDFTKNVAMSKEKSLKKMDVLLNNLNDEFVKNHTFSPKTKANFVKNNSKPNLNQFLTNQSNHVKKVEEKIALKKEEIKLKDEELEKEHKFIITSEVMLLY